MPMNTRSGRFRVRSPSASPERPTTPRLVHLGKPDEPEVEVMDYSFETPVPSPASTEPDRQPSPVPTEQGLPFGMQLFIGEPPNGRVFFINLTHLHRWQTAIARVTPTELLVNQNGSLTIQQLGMLSHISVIEKAFKVVVETAPHLASDTSDQGRCLHQNVQLCNNCEPASVEVFHCLGPVMPEPAAQAGKENTIPSRNLR